jgi:hypothetical protein
MTDTDVVLEIADLTADALKARFKRLCAETNNVHQNWQIRVHRSLSWLKRAGQFDAKQPEAKFLFMWISLNSLYSRWSPEKNAPDIDGRARKDFLAKVCALDKGVILERLRQSRGLVKKLLSDPFLAEVFWRDPQHPKAKGWATEDSNYLDRNLKSGEVVRVLGQVVDRMFVLRGQIVHGASTGGSKLNRKTLNYCLLMLEIIVPVMQQIVIDHGCNDDWAALCYPPT